MSSVLSLCVMASPESLFKQPGRTSNASRSRKTKICMKRSSAMLSCRSACVKRYFDLLTRLHTLTRSNSIFKVLSLFCFYSFRESKCGPMPRSVSAKCEPVFHHPLLQPLPVCFTNRTLHTTTVLILSHGYTDTRTNPESLGGSEI